MKKHGIAVISILFWGAVLSIPISHFAIKFNILQVTPKTLTLFFWVVFAYLYLFVIAKHFRKVLAFVFIAAMGALISFVGFDIVLPRQAVVRHEGVAFDSDSSSVFYSRVKEFLETRPSLSKEIKVHFRIKPGKIVFYDNVFQTSGWAGGIRFEINPQTLVPALIVGSSKSDKTDAFILPALHRGQWDTVDISISRNGRVLIFFNGKKAVDGRTSNFDFKIDDILVGKGYDDQRFFHGSIEDFNIDYKLFMPNPLKIWFFIIFLILSADLFINPIRGLKRLAVLGVLSLALAAAYYAGDYMPLKQFSSSHKVSKYDSLSSDPAICAPTEFVEIRPAQKRDLKISFKMKVYDIKYFPNVFQTAPYGDGVRMEISPANAQAYLLISTGRGTAVAVPFGQKIEFGKDYAVSIDMNKDGHVEATWNGKKVIDELIPYANYRIDNIAIGMGYDEQRVLEGELTDFNFNYTLYLMQRNNLLVFGLMAIIVLLLAFAAAEQLMFANNLIMARYFRA